MGAAGARSRRGWDACGFDGGRRVAKEKPSRVSITADKSHGRATPQTGGGARGAVSSVTVQFGTANTVLRDRPFFNRRAEASGE